MVCVLTSSAVDDGFELASGQTKDYIKSCQLSNFIAISWRDQVNEMMMRSALF
jgi:hypothetical protein